MKRANNAYLKILGLRLVGFLPFYLAKEVRRIASSQRRNVSVIDIGAGDGAPWLMAQLTMGKTQVDMTTVDAVQGPDGKDYFSRIPQLASVNRLWGDAIEVLQTLENDSYDFAVALDVIEHLPKHSGYVMMYHMNRVSRFGFGLSTPNEFKWQPPSPTNPFQAHISGWRQIDFRHAGLRVRTLNGLRIATAFLGSKKYKVSPATGVLYFLECLVAKLAPNWAASVWAFTRKKLPVYDKPVEPQTTALMETYLSSMSERDGFKEPN